MKLHPAVTKHKSEIKRVATLIGLNEIDFDETYALYKTGAKNPSRMGYPDEMLAMSRGTPFVVGAVEGSETYVWLVVVGLNDWFKTSPILSCRQEGNIFKIETQNSYYELRK